MILRVIPALLPCKTCLENYPKHADRIKRIMAPPTTPDEMFKWLWHLKDQVNKSLKQRSMSMDDVRQKFDFHGPVIDEVLLADSLVLMSMASHQAGKEGIFYELCDDLKVLLPLPHDSEFKRFLEQQGSQYKMFRASRAARVERGLNLLPLKHYQSFKK